MSDYQQYMAEMEDLGVGKERSRLARLKSETILKISKVNPVDKYRPHTQIDPAPELAIEGVIKRFFKNLKRKFLTICLLRNKEGRNLSND